MADEQRHSESYRAYRVNIVGERVSAELLRLTDADLPDGDVLVEVAYSSLNYKDALSARGRPGVTRHYPHTPGIDAAGRVLQSRDPRFAVGSEVIVTSYGLGVDVPGGFGERIRVPGDWVVPLPAGLSSREAMVLGTAGLTAALALDSLERYGIEPGHGPVVVTGASGGVGTLATSLLARQGYEVVGSSGTPEARDLLLELGAARVIGREELGGESNRPLLKQAYAAAIDSVGGDTLVNLLKSLHNGGAAAACGLVQSPELHMNVYPFILRGAALLGVDSAHCPMARREEIWTRLANEWKPAHLEKLSREIGLDELDEAIEAILQGRTVGRLVVRVAGQDRP